MPICICGAEHNNKKFCSNKCVGTFQRKYVEKPCKNCGTLTKNIFCSTKCSGSYNTKGRVLSPEHKEKIRRTIVSKLSTGEIIPHKTCTPYTDERRKLSSERLKKYYLEKFLEETKNKKFEELTETQKKKLVRMERGNKCEECGYNKVDDNGSGPYQLHHIDGNAKNNSRENLLVLCLNCHWATPNFAFRNRKHKEETKAILRERTINYLSKNKE